MNPETVGLAGKAIEQAGKVFDWLSTRETEKTEREAINAEKEIFIAKIKAFTDITKHGLDKEYDERKIIFKELFSMLDKCLDDANKHRDEYGLKLVTGLRRDIMALAKDSPIKQLDSSLKQLGSSRGKSGSPYEQLGE